MTREGPARTGAGPTVPAGRPEDSRGGWSQPGTPTEATTGAPPSGPRYALGAMLGQGGMGVVHTARDLALGRDVALKELRPEQSDDLLARQRLEREAAITGRLDHPGIVAVHDVGSLPDGRPFYTMRLVRGRSLAEVAATDDADARRGLLRHLLAAAEAVAAAHDVGIVHRDLKPSNILVGAHGETQVADWGVAAPVPEEASRWSGLPGSSADGPVGTERFMSPEQRGGALPARTDDVYSLGVTLRDVLGSPLDAELAAVAARATAPTADARYPDAGALAVDLLAYFEGRRVAAYAYSPTELLKRAIQAYRLPLLVSALGVVAVGAAVATGWWQTASALDRALRAEATASDRLAEVQLESAIEAARAGQRELAERLAVSVLQRRDDPRARGVFASFGREERPVMVDERAAPTCVWSTLAPGADWLVCAAAGALSREEGGQRVWSNSGEYAGAEIHGDVVLAWNSIGLRVAMDAATGRELGRWERLAQDWIPVIGSRLIWLDDGPLRSEVLPPSGCRGRIQVAATRPDGRFAALCDDGMLIIARASGEELLRLPTDAHDDHVGSAIAWTNDGLLVGSVRGRLLHFDNAGRLRSATDTHLGLIDRIVVSGDGGHAGLRGPGGRVGLWRIDTASLVAELETGALSLAFSPAGLTIHIGDAARQTLHTWRIPEGAPAVLNASAGLADAVPSPDGKWLALAGGDGFAAVAELHTGELRITPVGARVVKTAAFAPDGPWFTGLDAPFVQRTTAEGEIVSVPGARPLRRLVALQDGGLLGPDLDVGLYWWPRVDEPPINLARDRTFADLDSDGEHVVLLDGTGRTWRWKAGELVDGGAHVGARAVAVHGDTVYIATREQITDGKRIWAAETAGLLDVAVSDDGERLAAGALDGRVHIWNTRTGALELVLSSHRERVVSVDFLPDGDLVSASWDRSARLADLGVIDTPVAELSAAVEKAWGRE